MSERLGEIDFCEGCPWYGEPNGCNREEGECKPYREHLELIEAEKESIKVPCKAGDRVWMFVLAHNDPTQLEVLYGTVESIVVTRTFKSVFVTHENLVYVFNFSDFGETVFRTRFEADEALAKLQEEK